MDHNRLDHPDPYTPILMLTLNLYESTVLVNYGLKYVKLKKYLKME